MSVLCFGFCALGGCGSTGATGGTAILTPSILPDARSVLAASLSSTVALSSSSTLDTLWFGNGARPPRQDLAQCQFLGRNDLLAYVNEHGELYTIEDSPRKALGLFGLTAMNSRGQILTVQGDHLLLFESLQASFETPPRYLEIVGPESEILQLVAGSGHFLLRTRTSLFGLGDNRYHQLLFSPVPHYATLIRLPLPDEEISPFFLASGDFHSALLTSLGAIYMWGDDRVGQCGGFGVGGMEMILLEGDDSDILCFGCGAGHTIFHTALGGTYVSGENFVGQLGLGHKNSITSFALNASIPNKVDSILCSTWTNFITLS